MSDPIFALEPTGRTFGAGTGGAMNPWAKAAERRELAAAEEAGRRDAQTPVGSPDVPSAAQGRDTLPSQSGTSGDPPPGDGYWGAKEIPQEHSRVFDYSGTVLGTRGVRSEIGARGMDALLEIRGGATPTEEARHGYDLSRYGGTFITPKAKAQVAYVLNRMHDAQAKPAEVEAFLDLVLDLHRIAARRQLARRR